MKKILLFSALLSFYSMASSDVTSREYKLILNNEMFSFENEHVIVEEFMILAAKNIANEIDRDVQGNVYLSTQRNVSFYDVKGECTLKNLGYSFRDRVTDGESEVTLKFRSPDRFIAGFEDLSSPNSDDTKLESDIGANDSNEFKVVYSHSTKVNNTRTINNLKDINTHFSGFEYDYKLDNGIDIEKVGGLTIYERVYDGFEIDLGSIDADISVTLWYKSYPFVQEIPILAEVDFKVKDSSAKYTKKVINRAKIAFDTLRKMEGWVLLDSDSKTNFIYNYDPSFCN